MTSSWDQSAPTRTKRARCEENDVNEEDEGRKGGDSILRLNVGGTNYDVTASLFSDAAPDSMLASLCSPTWKGNRMEDADGRIFIDRDGITFRYILNYLRSGVAALQCEDLKLLHQIRVEADYYGLIELREEINRLLVKNVHGLPMSFRKDSWARIQGQAQIQDVFKSWTWSTQTGNKELVDFNTTSFGSGWTVKESGLYLLLVRLYYSPQHRIEARSYYKDPGHDEFCTVTVVHKWQAEHHAPTTIVRFGLWDYRDEDDTLEDPMYATATCLELVHLHEGDRVSINYALDRGCISYKAQPPNSPSPELLQSCTFVRMEGSAAARYERKSLPDDATTCAWSPVDLMMPPSKFIPNMSEDKTVLEPPVSGTYFVFGRVATAIDPPSSGLGHEYQCARIRVMFPFGHELLSNPLTFFSADYYVYEDYENTSEPGAFADVFQLEEGCKLDLFCDGAVYWEDHGTKNYPGGKVPWQNLTLMRLSLDMPFDRYETGATNHWRRSMPSLGPARTPLLQVQGYKLVLAEPGKTKTLLIVASLPPMVDSCHGVAMFVNQKAVAISCTLTGSGQCHFFHEIVELHGGDSISFRHDENGNFVFDKKRLFYTPSCECTPGNLTVIELL